MSYAQYFLILAWVCLAPGMSERRRLIWALLFIFSALAVGLLGP